MTRLAPGIAWELMSSRITIKKILSALGAHTQDNRDHLISQLLDYFSAGAGVRADVNRFAEVQSASYPRRLGAMSMFISDSKRQGDFERMAARTLLKFRKALAEMLIELPTVDIVFHISSECKAGVSLDSVPADISTDLARWEGFHLIGLKVKRSQLWSVTCDLVGDDTADGVGAIVRLQIPTRPKPLMLAMEHLVATCFSPDCKNLKYINIRAYAITWDRHNFLEATIVDSFDVCNTLRQRGARKKKQTEEPDNSVDEMVDDATASAATDEADDLGSDGPDVDELIADYAAADSDEDDDSPDAGCGGSKCDDDKVIFGDTKDALSFLEAKLETTDPDSISASLIATKAELGLDDFGDGFDTSDVFSVTDVALNVKFKEECVNDDDTPGINFPSP